MKDAVLLQYLVSDYGKKSYTLKKPRMKRGREITAYWAVPIPPHTMQDIGQILKPCAPYFTQKDGLLLRVWIDLRGIAEIKKEGESEQ